MVKLAKCTKRLVIWIFCQIFRIKSVFFKVKSKLPNYQDIHSILIYGYMGLGNMLFFTPTIRAIKNTYPKAHIALLVGNNTGCEEVVRGSKIVDEIIDFNLNGTNIFKKIRFIKKMRDRHFDLLISEFHGASSFLALLTALSNIPCRIGHCTSPGWNNKYDYVYDFKVKMAENEHEIDRGLRLAYAIGAKENEVDKAPVMWIREEDRDYAHKFLRQHGISDQDLLIGVQVGTSPTMRWKQWNLDRYAGLADRIVESYGAKIVLLGSHNEISLVNYVKEKMKCIPIIAAGKTTIKQAAAIIEKCKLFICNDSGLMHVSAAVGTPVIAIYGPTDYHRTAPYGNGHIIIRKDLPCSPCFKLEGGEMVQNCPYNYRCLNSISVGEVFEAVMRKLRSD